jgi:hypothetical protein
MLRWKFVTLPSQDRRKAAETIPGSELSNGEESLLMDQDQAAEGLKRSKAQARNKSESKGKIPTCSSQV